MNTHDINIANLRKNYSKLALSEENTSSSPFEQFSLWFQEAYHSGIEEPNIMALATISEEGYPENRIVLLKGFSESGFRFFTNYRSNKARNIAFSNKAALLFFYQEMERQIRIKGTLKKVDPSVSEEYFTSRPRESQIGAWASEQSSIIGSRAILEERFHHYNKKFGEHVPKPEHWGGYELEPVYFEFWQGGSNRLHDRIMYQFSDTGWVRHRLAP